MEDTTETPGYRIRWTDWLPGGLKRYWARTLPEARERLEMYGCFPDPSNFQRKRIFRSMGLADYHLILNVSAVSGAIIGLAKILS